MPYQLTVSPDFNTRHLAGWFILNNRLQHALETGIHVQLYDDFESQRAAAASGQIDLIYANPYDAASLVRTHGFRPLVKPRSKADECIIAVPAASPVQAVEDLQPGITIASTDDPDVHMMGMIMLEPADLNADNVTIKRCENYVLVAKELMRDTAQAGFFLATTFQELSKVIREQLRPIVESQIYVIHHVFLAGPRLADQTAAIRQALLHMNDDDKGRSILAEIGIPAWDPVEDEEVEFMIDLMDTLT